MILQVYMVCLRTVATSVSPVQCTCRTNEPLFDDEEDDDAAAAVNKEAEAQDGVEDDAAQSMLSVHETNFQDNFTIHSQHVLLVLCVGRNFLLFRSVSVKRVPF